MEDTKKINKILRALRPKGPLAHRANSLQPVYSSTFSVSDGFWHHTTASSSLTSDATASATGHEVAVTGTTTGTGAGSFASADSGNFHKKTAVASLGSGEVAGIVISSVFAVAAMVSLLLYFCVRRKRQQQQQQQNSPGGGRADDDEERLRPGTGSPAAVFPKIRHSSSVSTHDDPPTYEEIQHEYPRQSAVFASGATTDGFRQYRFEPPPDQGNKLGP